MRSQLIVMLALALVSNAVANRQNGVRKRANLRACFATQKTVAGAIEMWDLDRKCRFEAHLRRGDDFAQLEHASDGKCLASHMLPGTDPRGKRPVSLTVEALETLKKEGYLQSLPCEPGSSDTHDFLVLVSFGNGVLCLNHGDIGHPSCTPRQTLIENGGAGCALTERAADEDPLTVYWWEDPTGVLAIVAIFVGLLSVMLRVGCNPNRGATELFAGAFGWGALGICALIPAALLGHENLALEFIFAQVGAAAGAIVLGVLRAAGTIAPAHNPTDWRASVAGMPLRSPLMPLALIKPDGLKCAVCATDGGPAGWVACPACNAAHHSECWAFQDGCAAFGCALAHGRWRGGPGAVKRASHPAHSSKSV